MAYDGDGRKVKTADPFETTYYLPSSVLGGQVLTEVTSAGEKKRTFVYGDALLLLAMQWTSPSPFVQWEMRDAANSSVRVVHQSGVQNEFYELDPVGGDVEMENPYLEEPEYRGRTGMEAQYPNYGNVVDLSGGCTLDGVWVPCSMTLRLMESGATAAEYLIRDGDRLRYVHASVESLGLGLFRSQEPYNANGEIGMRYFIFTLAPQPTPQQTAQIIMVPIDADKLKGLIQDRLNYGDCAKYAANLINKAAELTNGANPEKSTNIMALFDEIRGQSKGGVLLQPSGAPHPHYPNLQLPAGGGGWAWGIYAQGNATINVPPMGYYSDRPEGAARIPYTYGVNGLHEVIHLSGKFGTYSDGLLTQAARLLEPDAGIGTGDQAWGEALKRHCVPPKYR